VPSGRFGDRADRIGEARPIEQPPTRHYEGHGRTTDPHTVGVTPDDQQVQRRQHECDRHQLRELDAEVEREQRTGRRASTEPEAVEDAGEGDTVHQSERGGDDRLATANQRTDRMHGGHGDGGGNDDLDRAAGEHDPSERRRDERDRVPHGERCGDVEHAARGRGHTATKVPPARRDDERRRQQQGHEEQQMVGTGGHVMESVTDHVGRPDGGRAVADRDRRIPTGEHSRRRHLPGVLHDQHSLMAGNRFDHRVVDHGEVRRWIAARIDAHVERDGLDAFGGLADEV